MAVLSLDHARAFAFGILGNIISFMVYLAPLPTFYRIYPKKSTEGFESVPYVVALCGSMLWIYYAFLNTSVPLLITINSFGCVIETIYIVMYLIYAPKKAKIFTVKILFLFNVVIFGLILLLTLFLSAGDNRVRIVGWVCVAFSVSFFVLLIRIVIRTKSVKFMPFFLFFFLTLSAVAWFFYGIYWPPQRGMTEYTVQQESQRGTVFTQRKLLSHGMTPANRSTSSLHTSSVTTQRVDGCTKNDIRIHQGATAPLPNGKPTYTVQVLNVCAERTDVGCELGQIHLSCGWFSSDPPVDPNVFRRVRYNDCLVNDGQPLPSGSSLSFQYANSFPYRLTVSSAYCVSK